MGMAKFRKKPVVIEAIQIVRENLIDISQLSGDVAVVNWGTTMPTFVTIKTREGIMNGSWGDWIIKGIAGEFYPCKPDIFEATYEKV